MTPSVQQGEADLLPCPFCGSERVNLVTNSVAGMSWVACLACGLETPSETGVTADDAVTYWNRRTDATEITRLRAALAAQQLAARHIMPYLRFTIGDESPGHHPTMPSAVAAFKEAFPPETFAPLTRAILSPEPGMGK